MSLWFVVVVLFLMFVFCLFFLWLFFFGGGGGGGEKEDYVSPTCDLPRTTEAVAPLPRQSASLKT